MYSPEKIHANDVTWEEPARTVISTQSVEEEKYFAGHNIVKVVFIGNSSYWTVQKQSSHMQLIRDALGWWKQRMPKTVYYNTFEQEFYNSGISSGEDAIISYFKSRGNVHQNVLDAAIYENYLLKTKYNGLFSFHIFVMESQGSSFAYINGPYTVIYRTDNVSEVVAHEVGHIYNALDQYGAATLDCRAVSGIYNVENQNSSFSKDGRPCALNVNSIMKDHMSYRSKSVDSYALAQMGYRDSDFDHLIDVIDKKQNYVTFIPIMYR